MRCSAGIGSAVHVGGSEIRAVATGLDDVSADGFYSCDRPTRPLDALVHPVANLSRCGVMG